MKVTQKELQAYHTPQVTDYGNIKQITMAVGANGKGDGGTKSGKKKSQP